MKFTLRYVHKVSQRCKCGRTQYDHSREPRDDEKARYPYPGQRVYGDGPYVRFHDGVQTCAGYEPETESIYCDAADVEILAKKLAGGKCDVRRESDGRIVCFPRRGIWHSLIFTPVEDSNA